jgi:ATP synthase assembly factor FMC1
MSTTTTKPALRALYRAILRELPTSASHPTHITATRTTHAKLSAPSSVQRRVRSIFASSSSSDSNTAAATTVAQVGLAEQAVLYAQAQREYCALIERYNPGMGMSEEERVRLSARRIGMNLPKEFVAGEEDEGGKK